MKILIRLLAVCIGGFFLGIGIGLMDRIHSEAEELQYLEGVTRDI